MLISDNVENYHIRLKKYNLLNSLYNITLLQESWKTKSKNYSMFCTMTYGKGLDVAWGYEGATEVFC